VGGGRYIHRARKRRTKGHHDLLGQWGIMSTPVAASSMILRSTR
jgi:hypothetical protein